MTFPGRTPPRYCIVAEAELKPLSFLDWANSAIEPITIKTARYHLMGCIPFRTWDDNNPAPINDDKLWDEDEPTWVMRYEGSS